MEIAIEFRNRRGKRLRGMIHKPGTGARRVPGVVFFHGFTGDRMESHWIFIKCARALAKAGIAALRFDFYGSGESDGEFREVTLQSEIADAKSAVNFFRKQKGIDGGRLGICGLSMGGAVAATVAPWSKARALVLWSALAHPKGLRRLSKVNTLPLPNGAREYNAHEVSMRFLESAGKVRPLEAIRRFKAPTLIIHPEKDEHLPLHHAEDFFLASGAKVKEKIIVPGADHTYTSIAWEREVIGRTTEWFSRYLAR
jgi:dipeptidyl aminopeptidase/acylaminoacyl peptidase